MKYKVQEYIDGVLSDKIPACKYVKLAVRRYLKDLETGHERGLYFDEEDAKYAIDFFGFLRHSKGEWAGQIFELEAWEQFIIWNVFGWKKADGTRRFSTVYIEVPRKNGKSTLIAGIGVYMFFADGEPGAEVYSAATKRDQACITHSEATRMVKSSKALNSRIKIFKNNMNIVNTASKFEPLGADADTMDGLNVHCAIIDELHAHKTRDLWDVLDTATGSRRQPIIFAITTAGFDKQSVCWEQHEHTEKILEGIIEDDSYFGIIYTIDEGDDWFSEDTWRKANPNYGISVKPDDMKRLAEQAKAMPRKLNAFLRLKLNVWTEAETRWFTSEVWSACKGNVNENDLAGCICYAGLDLSSTSDITAFILVFPPAREGENYKVLCRFFIPANNIRDRVRKDRVPYDVWVRDDYIIATPGNVIDYAYVFAQIDKDAKNYNIREVAFDRWGASKITPELEDRGLTMVEFGQGFKSMSPPCKDLERFILSRQIEHGGHPVLNWMASNVVIKEDPAGNIKPDKSKSTEKIDGIVGLVMGLDRAIRNNEETSIYEEQGVFVI